MSARELAHVRAVILRRLRDRLRPLLTPQQLRMVNMKAIADHLLERVPEDWQRYHIDHVSPLCQWNLEDPDEFRAAMHPYNHQWLSAKENCSKQGVALPGYKRELLAQTRAARG